MDENNKNADQSQTKFNPWILLAIGGVVLLGLVLAMSKKNSSTKEVLKPTEKAESITNQIEEKNESTKEASPEEDSEKSGVMEKATIKEFTIEGKNFSFNPVQIKVKKGDRLKITFNNVEGFHDFVIDEFNTRTKQIKVNESDVVEFTADKAGSFEYYCSVGKHREMGMKGTLIVE
ncbi:MAG: cupredoxin domain-containing protein [Patescibacteria group bacterium]